MGRFYVLTATGAARITVNAGGNDSIYQALSEKPAGHRTVPCLFTNATAAIIGVSIITIPTMDSSSVLSIKIDINSERRIAVSTFIISILAFLLTIFPSCGILLAPYQSLTFPGESVITDKIMIAVESGDIDAVESMMAENVKESVEDLSDQIGKLVDAIDGEIVEYDWSPSGGNDISDYGKRYSSISWDIHIKTSTKNYTLIIGWIVVDSREPEKVGMDCMILLDPDLNGTDDFWRIIVQAD